MMLQGLTVQYLLRRLYVVPKAGDTILFHAAAGGIGLIACQWAKALGINLIGTVGSEEKAALAREHGAAHTIIYTKEDFQARVMEITGGKKVPIVYDSVGKDTWAKSLDCLQVRGLMVSFGNSSGAVRPHRPGHSRGERLAVRDPAFARRLYHEARRAGGLGEGALRHGARRQGEGGPAPDLRAQGRPAGASRPGSPQDHRIDDPRPVGFR